VIVGHCEKGLSRKIESDGRSLRNRKIVGSAHPTLATDTIPLNNPQQLNPSKITLSSIVPSQQFVSTDNPNHNLNPLALNLYPTASDFWQLVSPINVSIEITDRPTGQLAEANITRFDPSGRPTSGTLTLDTDANGLGWFIDSTPWDNAEFGTLNSETFFRATLGSEAYGHYDLSPPSSTFAQRLP
jgi:hypothetical protein